MSIVIKDLPLIFDRDRVWVDPDPVVATRGGWLLWYSLDDFEAQMIRWHNQVVEHRRAGAAEPTAENTRGHLPAAAD